MLLLLVSLLSTEYRWDIGQVKPCAGIADTFYFGTGDRIIRCSSWDTLSVTSLDGYVRGINTSYGSLLAWSDYELYQKRQTHDTTLYFTNQILYSCMYNDSLFVSLNNKSLLLMDSTGLCIDSLQAYYPINFMLPINDTVLIAGSGGNGIFVYNLSTKDTISSFNTPGYVNNFCIMDSFLYEGDGNAGLNIFKMGNNFSLTLIESVNTQGYVHWVSIDTVSKYLAVSNNGNLLLYDVSIPNAPVLTSTIHTTSWGSYIIENTVWSTSFYRMMEAWDITDPSSPYRSYYFKSTGIPRFFLQKDSLLFLAGGVSGGEKFTIDTSIKFQARYNASADIKNLSMFNDTVMFLPLQFQGLHSLNVAHKDSISLIKQFNINAYALTPVRNNIMFSTVGDSLIGIYCVMPDSIEIVSNIYVDKAYELVWENNLISVSGNDSLIYIIDVQNPYSPHIQSEIYTGHIVYNTDIKDTLLVTSEGTYGVKIWNISNPSSPSVIDSISGIDARRVMLWGEYLYINGNNGWMYIYSLLDPSNPSKVDSFFFDDYPAGLSKGKNMVFVGSGSRGFWGLITEGYDIFPPQPPEAYPLCMLQGSFWTSEESVGVLINSEERLGNLYLKYYESPSGDYDTTFSKIYADTIYLRNLTQGIDTLYIWASDTAGNLDYRFHSFFVIGYDTSPPPSPSPVLPQDSGYAGDTINFIWHGVYDNLSGVKTYKFQLSSDSLFTNILIDTSIPDTSLQLFAINLPVETQLFWHVSSIDYALNTSQWSSMWNFSIDTTAPGVPDSIYVNNRNLVSPWTRNDTFTIQYFYSQQDFSGLNRVYLKQGTPPMSNSDTSASFNQNPFIYLFEQEGVETLYIWLSDSAGNSNYLNNSICIVRRDTSPPDSITTVQVLPEDWTIDSMFSVTWQNPSDLSGITGYYLKKFTPPVLPYDSSFSTEVESINITADSTGRIPLYLWCEDSAGNNSFTRPSLFYIKRDTSPPLPPPLLLPDSGGKYNADEGLLWSVAIDSCSGVRFYVLQIDTTGLFNSPIFTDTIDTTFYVPLDIPGMCNIYWRVHAIDSAGNPSSWSSVWFFYNDNLAPYPPESILVNGRKTVSPWTSDSVFNITVFPSSLPSKGDTSQIKRVFVKAGSPPENDFDTTFTADDLEFQYIFTGCGTESLWCWLQDGAGNVNFRNHSVFIVRRDTVPPQAPTSISIYPDTWTNLDTFIMRIDYLEDLSGIASVFIKIENEPTSVTDTSFTSEPESIITFTVEKEGIIPIYIWLNDSAGLHSQYIHNEIYRDTTPPLIEEVFFRDTVQSEEMMSYTFIIEDTLSGVAQTRALLEFPDSSETIFSEFDSIWHMDFPCIYLLNGAIPKLISLDKAGNTTSLHLPLPLIQSQKFVIRDSLGNPLKFYTSHDSSDAILFSYPFLSNMTVSEFLEYNSWSNQVEILKYSKEGLTSLSGDDTLYKGTGYVLLSNRDTDSLIIHFPPGLIDLSDTMITLKKNWQLLGSPIPYSINPMPSSSYIPGLPVFWAFKNGWRIPNKIEPLYAYLLYSPYDTVLNWRCGERFFVPDSPYIRIKGFRHNLFQEAYILPGDTHRIITPSLPFFRVFSVDNAAIVQCNKDSVEEHKIITQDTFDTLEISLYGRNDFEGIVVCGDKHYLLSESPQVKLKNIREITLFTGPEDKMLSEVAREIPLTVNYQTIVSHTLSLEIITNLSSLDIKIYDMAGRLVKRFSTDSGALIRASTEIEHTGIYFIQILSSNRVVWKGRFISYQ